jgi:hypothetical protein
MTFMIENIKLNKIIVENQLVIIFIFYKKMIHLLL